VAYDTRRTTVTEKDDTTLLVGHPRQPCSATINALASERARKTEQIMPRLHQHATKQQQGLQNHSDFKKAHPLFFPSRDPGKNRERDDKPIVSVCVLPRSRDARPRASTCWKGSTNWSI